jgi:hypothetical protein
LEHPLRRALAARGISQLEAAAQLQIDPKTVERWCAGRLPYSRNRAALSELTGWPEHDLWPSRFPIREHLSGQGKLTAIYPCGDHMPNNYWRDFFEAAEHRIDMLTESARCLANNQNVLQVINGKLRAGVQIRLLIHNANGEDQADLTAGYDPQILRRLHSARLYNEIYRADDELLVVVRAYAVPTSTLPILRMSHSGEGSAAQVYLDSFEKVWIQAKEV